MAYGQNRVGYQYDTSPRKLRPEYEPEKNPYAKKKSSTLKQKKQKTVEKKKLKPHAKVVIYILIGFSILFAISYRNSVIMEEFNQKENLKKELNTIKKENAQLQIGIQNNLNLSNVEKSANSMLGMKKLDEMQKVYVNLPKKDYVEPASEKVILAEEAKSILEQVIDSIKGLFK